jgi:hypothetical protein
MDIYSRKAKCEVPSGMPPPRIPHKREGRLALRECPLLEFPRIARAALPFGNAPSSNPPQSRGPPCPSGMPPPRIPQIARDTGVFTIPCFYKSVFFNRCFYKSVFFNRCFYNVGVFPSIPLNLPYFYHSLDDTRSQVFGIRRLTFHIGLIEKTLHSSSTLLAMLNEKEGKHFNGPFHCFQQMSGAGCLLSGP